MNKNKSKNIVISVLVVLLGLSLYFGFFNNDVLFSKNSVSKQDLFKQKQECGSYRNDVEKLLQKDQELSLSREIFDEVFYSPSLNTCLYSYTVNYVDADGKAADIKIMGEDYIIVDYLTGRIVFSENSVTHNAAPEEITKGKDLRTVFEEEKATLKK